DDVDERQARQPVTVVLEDLDEGRHLAALAVLAQDGHRPLDVAVGQVLVEPLDDVVPVEARVEELGENDGDALVDVGNRRDLALDRVLADVMGYEEVAEADNGFGPLEPGCSAWVGEVDGLRVACDAEGTPEARPVRVNARRASVAPTVGEAKQDRVINRA